MYLTPPLPIIGGVLFCQMAGEALMKESILIPIITAIGGAFSGVLGTVLTQQQQSKRQHTTDNAAVIVAQISEESAFRKALLERVGALEMRVEHLETINEQLRTENLQLRTENERLKLQMPA